MIRTRKIKSPEVLYDFAEQCEWLESRSHRELKEWFERLLRENDTEPLFISMSAASPAGIIQGFYEGSNDISFKDRIKRIIGELIDGWRLSRDPDEMLFELSTLAGHICIAGARSKLLSLAKEGYLRGRSCRGVDLHFHLLRVLAGLKLSTDLKLLISRDFDNPAYAPILFVSSWLMGESGYFLAIGLLNRFINLHRENPGKMEFHYPLRKFLDSFGEANLKKHFGRIIDALEVDNMKYFLKSLDEIGYLVYGNKDSNIEIRILERIPLYGITNNLSAVFKPIKSSIKIPRYSYFSKIAKDKKIEIERALADINGDYSSAPHYRQSVGSMEGVRKSTPIFPDLWSAARIPALLHG
ncbi:MAG: hypothetical protein L0Y73_06400 [Candidatus Aminicenantes bacterium]|nr:hypothetical protein [Candidatus Aminicenantes bacterium]